MTKSNPTPTPNEAFGKIKQQPMVSLVASAQRLSSKQIIKNKRSGHGGGATLSWQEDAWDMYDLVGEERFLATTLAARLAQAKLFVGVLDENGEDPVPVMDKPEITNLMKAFGKTAAGRGQLMYRLAVNLFVAGEGWLVGIPDWIEDPDIDNSDMDPYNEDMSLYEWKMLSVSEVSVNSSTGKVTLDISDDEGDKIEAAPEDLILIRTWRPHPRRWWQADSPTRASLPVLRELVGLTMHISAQVDSRLAGAGLLIVPQSAQRALQVAAGLDENTSTDVFTEALIEAMLTPIGDRGSASAMVPLVVTVPDDVTDKFNFMEFSKPLDTEARNLRDEAIRRLALGQDAPPELLLGTGNMNHWGGWLVQEETISSHIEPPLALICDALTTQYLWPALEALGYTPEEAEEFVIWYDVEHMVVRPNRSSDALTLHQRGVISDKSLRESTGFEESDGPNVDSEGEPKAEQEPAILDALEMVRANPNLLVNPGIEIIVDDLRKLYSGEVDPPAEPEPVPEQLLPENQEPPAEEEEPAGELPSGEIEEPDLALPPMGAKS